MSQWASGLSAQLDRLQADIVDAGGVWTFKRRVLVHLDGTPTDARMCNTRYGTKWRVDSADKWLPYAPKREATLAKHGYREIIETATAPAKAIFAGSDACNVRPIIIRTDARKSDGWYPAAR